MWNVCIRKKKTQITANDGNMLATQHAITKKWNLIQNSLAVKKSVAPKKTIMKKDVKSNVAAKK